MPRALILGLSLAAAACAQFISSHEDDLNWRTFPSEHFTFFVRPGSRAEQDVDGIIQEQEAGVKRINTTLEVSFMGDISYYLYNAEEGDRLAHPRGGGFVYPDLLTIRWTYTGLPMGIHELVHMVADWTIGRAGTLFMSEGLAVALEGREAGRTIEEWRRDLVKPGVLVPVQELIGHFGDYPYLTRYVQSGSFVQYLLARYGANVVKRLYLLQPDEYAAGFQAACGDDLAQVEKEYIAVLRHPSSSLPTASRPESIQHREKQTYSVSLFFRRQTSVQ